MTQQQNNSAEEPPPSSPSPPKQFLTPEEVSARYGGKISVRTLANWRNLGTGPKYTKLGGRVMYRIADLEAWETANTVNSTSQYTRGGEAA